LRCQAQLELIFMMCLSDRSTLIGALSDHSTFTSTDVRVTNLHRCFFGGLIVVWGCGCLQEFKLSPPLSFHINHAFVLELKNMAKNLAQPSLDESVQFRNFENSTQVHWHRGVTICCHCHLYL